VSVFDDAFAAARTAAMDYMGTTVTYTPKGGSASEITAIPDLLDTDRDEDEHGSADVQSINIDISLADVASPATGDTVAIDGVDYTVAAVRDKAAGMATLECRRVDRVQHARSGWRADL